MSFSRQLLWVQQLKLEYHLLLARDLNFIQASAFSLDESLVENLVEVKRMLASFIKKLFAQHSVGRADS